MHQSVVGKAAGGDHLSQTLSTHTAPSLARMSGQAVTPLLKQSMCVKLVPFDILHVVCLSCGWCQHAPWWGSVWIISVRSSPRYTWLYNSRHWMSAQATLGHFYMFPCSSMPEFMTRALSLKANTADMLQWSTMSSLWEKQERSLERIVHGVILKPYTKNRHTDLYAQCETC